MGRARCARAPTLVTAPGEFSLLDPPPRNAGIYRTQARERCYPLQSGQWALPTVLLGATTIAIDDSGVWRLLLAREMKRAGLDVDLNRAL